MEKIEGEIYGRNNIYSTFHSTYSWTCPFLSGWTRNTRDGWPLLTVETEANGDSGSTYERGPSLVGSMGSSCQCRRFLSCLGCSSRPRTKYFCLTVHYFNTFYPFAQQAGQAVVPCRLSLNICPWAGHCLYYSIQYELHRESALILYLLCV
jgi:hypothetical protein